MAKASGVEFLIDHATTTRRPRDDHAVIASATRSLACPSHSAGAWPVGGSRSASARALGNDAGVTSRLVPSVMVIGRSVFGRIVKQATPSTVVSS